MALFIRNCKQIYLKRRKNTEDDMLMLAKTIGKLTQRQNIDWGQQAVWGHDLEGPIMNQPEKISES